LVTFTVISGPGHFTAETVALSGTTVGTVGVTVVRGVTWLGVGRTVRVTWRVGVLVGVADFALALAVAETCGVLPAVTVAVGVRVLLDAGVLSAREDDAERVSAGIAMSAPITKNTAAMMTLGNCMRPPDGPPPSWVPVDNLDHVLPTPAFCRLPSGKKSLTR
jgi:hypothetical protein